MCNSQYLEILPHQLLIGYAIKIGLFNLLMVIIAPVVRLIVQWLNFYLK